MSVLYNQYMNIISEHFDVFDDKTRKTLLHLNEDGKNLVLHNLTSKLYDLIVKKVDDIDFGTIPKSKGNITRIENYDDMIECINIINNIVKEYGEDTSSVDIVSQAIYNIKSRTAVFEKAYVLNIEYPIVVYNTIVLSIVSSISFLIASCIEFVKTPDYTFKMALDKTSYIKNKDYVLFKGLSNFNASCANGDMDKTLNTIIGLNIKTLSTAESAIIDINESIAGAAMAKAAATAVGMVVSPLGKIAAIAAILIAILANLKDIVYFLVNAKQSAADYLAMQADLIQLNATNLQYKNLQGRDTQAIYTKQMKYVDKLRRASNALQIKTKKASNDTMRDINNDKKRYRIDEISPDLTDTSLLF